MDNYSTRHTKGRPLPKTNYYPPTYGRTYRQNDYAFSSRNSALLWHDTKQMPKVAATGHSKGKYCSIALAAATFFVLIAVLSIAGLALYMGALRSEPSSPLITFLCRAKVVRGDRFIVGLVDKARRYRMQFETLYQRSSLGGAYVSSTVDKFGNDTRTIFFRVTLNRKKIPRQIYNVEKSLKDILLSDANSRKPVFPGIQFEAKSLTVKRVDADLYQRQPVNVSTKPKEITLPKRPHPHGMLTKPSQVATIKKITNDTKEGTMQSSFVQGSFKITKTDADITEKNTTIGTITATQLNVNTQGSTRPQAALSPSVVPPKLKETYVTSALFKLASAKPTTTTTTAPSLSSSPSSTSAISKSSTTATPTTTTTMRLPDKHSAHTTVATKVTTQRPINPFFGSNLFNQEPWVPIYHSLETSTATTTQLDVKQPEHAHVDNSEPIYTSFTNQGLSWQGLDAERLGSTKVEGHPLPVNKISDATSPIDSGADEVYFTTPYLIYSEAETPLSEETVMQGIENRQGEDDLTLLNDPSTTLETRFVEVATLKYPGMIHSIQKQLLEPAGTISSSTTTSTTPASTTSTTTTTATPESPNVGQAEVIEADEVSLMMATTKLPLVTLLPVKSNSGVGRPIRPRPKRPNETSETRSFATNSKINDFTSSGIHKSDLPYVHTEVVTSVSQEYTHKVKTNKNNLNAFQIVGVLNFATEIPTTTESSTSPPEELIKMEPQPFQQILTPEKLAELSKISKLNTNSSSGVISTKAVASASSNSNGFNMLTKTYNKIPLEDVFKEEKNKLPHVGYNPLYFESINASECTNYTIQCGDGQCLPNSTRCNNLVDCADGSDEKDCNCADYLRSQFLLKKICDGIVDCWDFSDENRCDWCQPGQYVCGNSKMCINRTSICDGVTDCPNGDDERQCVTVAPDLNSADEFPYNADGFLMVRKNGVWGKLCVANFDSVVSRSRMSWEVTDLGQAVCKAMTYKKLESTNVIKENVLNTRYEDTPYYELSYSFNNATKSSLTFENTTCEAKEVVVVKCDSLECGVRPQLGKKNARIVGGGNAGLGAWPWQAALYKEGEFQCGGTLISERWILSAGHCFYHSQNDHWVARMGNLRRGTSLPSPYEQLRDIISIHLHPGYVDVGFINDISLLRMEVPVIFSDYVRPICLPPAGVAPHDGRICTVIGWGQLFEIGRIFPDTLQEVQVPIISTAECRKRTLFLPLYQVTDDMFCAGYDRGGRDACLGDSGGPLMCSESDGRWTLHGITSNGYGCARAFRPGVYTKVANYHNWIQSYVNTNQTIEAKNNKKVDKCNGHRCPLGECLPKSRICNGFIECSDGSDENGCLKGLKS
ncbi:uncharacterized protein [Atheta coriaria]|uniref:uncharacterized protein isoform X2 n=1 Tax=Dalotia coriaria TaxID=877792 RepID=UPI0031F374F2